MAEIIRLEPHQRRPSRGEARADLEAAVIIFPGIRYEKPAETDDPSNSKAPAKRRKPRKAN